MKWLVREALRWLIKRYGLDIPPLRITVGGKRFLVHVIATEEREA